MTVKVIHRTHNCKLKGTPRTSNLSISKSTPIVALYVLSNVSLQNLEDRNINECNHSSFFFFTHMVGMYVKILSVINITDSYLFIKQVFPTPTSPTTMTLATFNLEK